MNKTPFTKQGYIDLTAELKKLQESRISAVQNLKTAREMGDLSENGAYRAARAKLSSVDSRIRRLQKIINSACVVDRKNDDFADIGSLITISRDGKDYKYQIVHTLEADISKNKISSYSPIGKALLGKKQKDLIVIQTPSGKKQYSIDKIE